MQFSIIVPALNESSTIKEVLNSLVHLSDDVIVVDGHSTDNTRELARTQGARVLLDSKKGKGDALRIGLSEVRHPVTVFIDADGSHNAKDIPLLVKPIAEGEADLVIASRVLGGSDEFCGSLSEVVRLSGMLVITLMINRRFGVTLTDYQNGFRAIRTSVGLLLGLESNETTIEQEMAMKCLRQGYKVMEIPSHEFRRMDGASKVNIVRLLPTYFWNLVQELSKKPEHPSLPPRDRNVKGILK